MENIFSEFLMIVPALNVVGIVLKHSIPQLSNKYIPLILMSLGIIATCGLSGLSVVNVIQGILVSSSAIGLHSVAKDQVKLIKNKENK